MSASEKHSGQADLRAFQYALQPFMQKEQWKHETLQIQLGRAEQAVMAMRSELQANYQSLEVQSSHLQQSMTRQANASAHQQGLQYLAWLQQCIAAKQH